MHYINGSMNDEFFKVIRQKIVLCICQKPYALPNHCRHGNLDDSPAFVRCMGD